MGVRIQGKVMLKKEIGWVKNLEISIEKLSD